MCLSERANENVVVLNRSDGDSKSILCDQMLVLMVNRCAILREEIESVNLSCVEHSVKMKLEVFDETSGKIDLKNECGIFVLFVRHD